MSPYIYRKKAFNLGLWLVWLSGFTLIALSFYATQMLHQISQWSHPGNSGGGYSSMPAITIFTAPRPFAGSTGKSQTLAIRSWLGLSADITVVLFSQDPSVFDFAGSFDSRVSVEPDIDFNFLGTPFFHSMVARSQASSSDICVLIDPETVLVPDFISTLKYAHRLDHDWLLVAPSRRISHFPFSLEANGVHWLADNGEQVSFQKDFVTNNWKLKLCEGRILMAWNNGEIPLHKGVLPPFLYGKGMHNHWIITEALSSDFRLVLDATGAITNFNNYLDHGLNSTSRSVDASATENSNPPSEFVGNSLLAVQYGSLYFHETNYSSLFRFFACGARYLIFNSAQSVIYPLGYHNPLSLRNDGIFESNREKSISDCIDVVKSIEGIEDCFLKDQLKPPTSLSLPFSLESLLLLQADNNKTIVLAVAGYSYKDMLMSWICRLRQLHVPNFLVCALDHEIYEFSVLQGLPVFKNTEVPTNISFDNCHFGTECFQKVTKVKSRMVLQILKLGYNVLMSDVDIYWFKNPLPFLSSFGPSIFVAQSDEYKKTGPINLPRRLNSGFYYAHSDGITVAALEKVVKHAAISNLSEQPSFYDILCGEGGSNRVGNNKCLEPESNLTVHFLDRDLFPNGAYQGLWEKGNVKEACMRKGSFILHNNWINGRRKKLERQVWSGLWEYDISTRMCLQSWHRTKFTSYF